jgi:hypothetical protein
MIHIAAYRFLYGLPVAEVVRGSWRPGIGDPTPAGWATVAAYLLAALCCVRAARAGRPGRVFWSVLGVLLLALGINKQLDLQSLVTVVGRRLARAQGWYARRRPVQLGFVALAGAAALAGLILLGQRARRWPAARRLAVVGLVYLAGFVVIRAASFHHVDRVLKVPVAGTTTNAFLELGGILCIGVAALLERGAADAPPHSE